MLRELLPFVFASVLVVAAAAQDRDGDGLTDVQELHKHFTDPEDPDSDGDGVPDGDWLERREYQYFVRSVVQVMRPVTVKWLTDDHQDVRLLDETEDHVELEVVHYPFTTWSLDAGGDARSESRDVERWLAPGPTTRFDDRMRERLRAKFASAGVATDESHEPSTVARASRWLLEHARYEDRFTTFVTGFDEDGRPFVPAVLRRAVDLRGIDDHWQRELFAGGMFEHGLRGSCTSTAIYLTGCLRGLGVPTRIVLAVPVVDASDPAEIAMVERGLRHPAVRELVLRSAEQRGDSWTSHTFNEVFVEDRWFRLDGDRLGRGILEADALGLITHVATFHDWADARVHETVGMRQTLGRRDDVFGHANPYSTIALRDGFGPHADPERARIELRVDALEWWDSAAVPDDISAWALKRERVGLVAKVRHGGGPVTLMRLLELSGRALRLEGGGTVELDTGAAWNGGEHVWVFVSLADEQAEGLRAAPRLRVFAREPGDGAALVVAPDVFLTRPD